MTDLLNLPTISAIYRVWHNEKVVYVGQTKNLKHLADASHLAEADSALRYGLDIGLDRDTAALFG